MDTTQQIKLPSAGAAPQVPATHPCPDYAEHDMDLHAFNSRRWLYYCPQCNKLAIIQAGVRQVAQ